MKYSVNAARGDRTQARLRPARGTGRIAPTDKYIVHQASDPSLRDTPHTGIRADRADGSATGGRTLNCGPPCSAGTAGHGTKDRTYRSASLCRSPGPGRTAPALIIISFASSNHSIGH